MSIYTIKNGEDIIGHFPGASASEALDNLALWIGGYGSFEQAMKETGEDASNITVVAAPANAKAYTDENGSAL